MTTKLSLSTKFVDDLARPGTAAEARPLALDAFRPVHVLYGGAHLYTAGSAEKLGGSARTALDTWGADPVAFGRTMGVSDAALAVELTTRVRRKLEQRAVEALCIDFEDGYGPRPAAEEDAEAVRTAAVLAAAPAGGPLTGIRIKALGEGTFERAVRTLDLFVTTLVDKRSSLDPDFSVTLPKVTGPAEVLMLATILDELESVLGQQRGRIKIELMIESPRALLDARGVVAIPALVEAARGRAVALHLGAYDLTAELGVTAGDQRLDHPLCDLARMLLRLSTPIGTIGVSDGATTLLPIPPKGATETEASAAVHRAWAMHAANVARAIDLGIWQGWDVHPAQLPARYGALFAHFLGRRTELATRLRTFVERATQASRVGQAFDDAATGQGLVSFFLRGLACGALDEDDLRATTLTKAELEARSFSGIVSARVVAS